MGIPADGGIPTWPDPFSPLTGAIAGRPTGPTLHRDEQWRGPESASRSVRAHQVLLRISTALGWRSRQPRGSDDGPCGAAGVLPQWHIRHHAPRLDHHLRATAAEPRADATESGARMTSLGPAPRERAGPPAGEGRVAAPADQLVHFMCTANGHHGSAEIGVTLHDGAWAVCSQVVDDGGHAWQQIKPLPMGEAAFKWREGVPTESTRDPRPGGAETR